MVLQKHAYCTYRKYQIKTPNSNISSFGKEQKYIGIEILTFAH